MSYFEEQYKNLKFPVAIRDTTGLFNAQLGAIHSIASHFTLNSDAAIITMPTGSGKTAVLMITPYLLRINRALVITPSRMVRDQIRDDFESLRTLKEIGVFDIETPTPRVFEVKSKIDSKEKWEMLRNYDVVVSTPNCASSAYPNIPEPPNDLFDLILIDEAHHSPAKTWNELIESFPGSRDVLFTATPFRRDNKEIKGRFIYNYPIGKAYEDGIYGKISFIPVVVGGVGINHDIAIAQKAEQILKEDRNNGFDHCLMVRTDSKIRAKELFEVYKNNTNLRLALVYSDISARAIKRTITKLNNRELEGIICVYMLGEGFNFPNLKIAAIHAPHKSLEVTLQFIGRFARTRGVNLGDAKFLAIPNDIEIEGKKLFRDDRAWQEMIIGLSEMRIGEEQEVRSMLSTFSDPQAIDAEIKDLSLYSLTPRAHVKIYRLTKEIDIESPISLKPPFEIYYRNTNKSQNVTVLIAGEATKPRWSKVDKILDIKFDLFILYYDKDTSLLFVNSSRSIDGVYEEIIRSIDEDAKGLPTNKIKRVLKGLSNTNFFNIGMRSMRQTGAVESYRTIAGPSTQNAVKKSDGFMYKQGHAFGTAEEEGKKINIGYSSASKVWSSNSHQIPSLVNWCRALAKKIVSEGNSIKTNSGLDYLSEGEVVSEIPDGIIAAEWDKDAYDFENPTIVNYTDNSGNHKRVILSELELSIITKETDKHQISLILSGDDLSLPMKFNLNDYFDGITDGPHNITLEKGQESLTLQEYLEQTRITFYTADSSILIGNELFTPLDEGISIAPEKIQDNEFEGVDIKKEFGPPDANGISIHEYVRNRLLADVNNTIVFYDHGSGEIADFIAIRDSSSGISFQFYHCKASSKSAPGKRVGDLYELCGQAQKSTKWTMKKNLIGKLGIRARDSSKFNRGNNNTLNQIMDKLKNYPVSFEMVLIQPGVSKEQIKDDIAFSKILGATHDLCILNGFTDMYIYTSK